MRMLIVADNLQLAAPAAARALRRRDAAWFRRLAAHLERAGAEAIDVNTGPLGREAADDMAFLLPVLQSATRLPLLIDTVAPRVMEAALAAARRSVMLNGVSLEPRKREGLIPLAARAGAEVVAFALDAQGQVPATLEGRLAAAVELYRVCREAGLADRQLIFDPVVAPLVWADGLAQNRVVLEFIRHLPAAVGAPVRTMAGLSNLTTGLRDARRCAALEQSLLPMLAAAGLDLALLNVTRPGNVGAARNARLLARETVFALESVQPPPGPAD